MEISIKQETKMRELVLRSMFLISFGYLPILSMYKIILYMTSLLFHFHTLVFLHLLPLESQSTVHVLYFVLETSFINSRTQALLLSGFCLAQNMSSQDTSLEHFTCSLHASVPWFLLCLCPSDCHIARQCFTLPLTSVQ